MSLVLQVIAVALIVAACLLYSTWRLLSGSAAATRARAARPHPRRGRAGMVREVAGAHAGAHAAAAAAAARPPLALLPGNKHLAHFPVRDAFLVAPFRVA